MGTCGLDGYRGCHNADPGNADTTSESKSESKLGANLGRYPQSKNMFKNTDLTIVGGDSVGFEASLRAEIALTVGQNKMKRFATFTVVVLMQGVSSATDWKIPDPVTYEWTAKQIQQEIPRVDFKNASLREVIGFLGDSMVYPIELQHELPKDLLERRVEWKFTKVSWIDLVAKIADVADAEIVIGKRVVTLKLRKPDLESGNVDKLQPESEKRAH